MKKVLAICLALSVLILAFVPVYGGELDDLRSQQRQIDRQIQEHRETIQAKNRELKTLSGQMEDLDRNITAVEKDLDTLHEQLTAAMDKVEQVQGELNEAEKDLQERTEIFKKRLVEIYHHGDVSYLEVLMESTSMTDFLVRMELLQKIAENDMKLLDQIEKEKALIEEKKVQLEKERDKIAQVKKETEAKKARLAEQQQEKTILVEALKHEKETIERALAEEEEASRKLASKIREIQARLAGDRQFAGGKVAWPTPGSTRITDDYGMRLHPVLKQRRMHTGIDIAAPMGSKVVAVDNGKAIFVGPFGAYGNTVVIDHGSGISSMYAHLSAFTVKEGDEVLRGDQIGKIGTSGISTGPHLHFEIRKNGESISPWPYLK